VRRQSLSWRDSFGRAGAPCGQSGVVQARLRTVAMTCCGAWRLHIQDGNYLDVELRVGGLLRENRVTGRLCNHVMVFRLNACVSSGVACHR